MLLRTMYNGVLGKKCRLVEDMIGEKIKRHAARPEIRDVLCESTKGGRRFRPLLLLLTLEGVGGEWQDGLELACGIEFLHKASLVHDDLIDEDRRRRGIASFWVLHGPKIAIATGDALVGIAFKTLNDWTSSVQHPRSAEISAAFSDAMYDMSVGEFLDLAYAEQKSVGFDAIDEMATLKSGSLIAACCRIGALLNNASADRVEDLAAFGRHLGTAFQIINDMNNVNGVDRHAKGMEAQDIVLGKKTRATLALEREGILPSELSRVPRDKLQKILLPVRARVKDELRHASVHLQAMPNKLTRRVLTGILLAWRETWFWDGPTG